jgi:exodeoxyribonuclease-3
MIQIVTWNINSVRARLEHLAKCAREMSPDIILLQEIKTVNETFPHEVMLDLGYNALVHGQKSYNGVAILSKGPIEDAKLALPGDDQDHQARYAECVTTIDGKVLRVASVYVPNGTSIKSENFHYKLHFFERLASHFKSIESFEEIFVVGGDYNVAPEDIDVYSPEHLNGQLGFHIEERKRIRNILSNGMHDIFRNMHPNAQEFSWWDYRSNGWPQNKGMRIDYLLANPQGVDATVEAGFYSEYRAMEKCSDHIPVFCKLKV